MIERCFGCDIDDRAVCSLQHRRNSGLREDKPGPQVQIEHPLKDVRVHLPQLQTASVPADGIDDDIESAMPLDNTPDQCIHGGGVRHVGLHPFQRGNLHAGGSFQSLKFGLISVGHNNLGAFFKKSKTYAPTEPTRTACHQYRLSRAADLHPLPPCAIPN